MDGAAHLEAPAARMSVWRRLTRIELRRRSRALKKVPPTLTAPPSNIEQSIPMSLLRCLLSLFSIVLFASDIPPSGLGVAQLTDYFPSRVEPSMSIYFGPYAYPVAHINHSTTVNGSDIYLGSKGTAPISTTKVWSYKYDTTSLGMRGAVALLNSSIFPACLQYGGLCPDELFQPLKTTFAMLDALVQQTVAFLQSQQSRPNSLPLWSFATQHYWIDRMHDYLFRFVSGGFRWRLHTITHFAKHTTNPHEPLQICWRHRRTVHPSFCQHRVLWKSPNPIHPSVKVPLWDHVELRIQGLQKRYPSAFIDITIFTTVKPATRDAMMLAAYYASDVMEIVMITRGRTCAESRSNCSTVFIDDYRYERGVVASNVADWYLVAALLRSIAQIYVWIRLGFLVAGCFHAIKDNAPPGDQPNLRRWAALATMTTKTLFKIPMHVIVYGSLLPILCYVLAHLVDSSIVDLQLQTYWSTVDSVNNFHFVDFFLTAWIQMRNVWILGLLIKIVAFVHTTALKWHPQDGILGVRGLAIGLISFLSIFGPFKSNSYRNCAIAQIVVLMITDGSGGRRDTLRTTPGAKYYNVSTEGFSKDMKMTFLAACIVMGAAAVMYWMLRLLRPHKHSYVLLGSSVVVPFSAGIMWPVTALGVRFHVKSRASNTSDRSHSSHHMTFSPDTNEVSISRPRGTALFAQTQVLPFSSIADAAQRRSLHLRWSQSLRQLHRLVSIREHVDRAGAIVLEAIGVDHAAELQIELGRMSLHDQALHFEARTIETNSLIRLVNIAMMTDPITLLRLRVIGVEVYFYRLLPSRRRREVFTELTDTPLQTVILPCNPDTMMQLTGYDIQDLEVVGHVSSTRLPWSMMLQCG
ncbi:TPA: hypothetical protein N0F65_010827 [Lagenidium giganteum]|uniref:Uncharacterized protein n=1 Tax=Lagenidium giganteum TaxID=4803 RepID=A0AAV2Z9C9_9STRA|nr:TPA: hypothetical protein N0F65_010827 [Lagenidium giganteum]